MKKNRYSQLFIATTDTVTGIGGPVSKETEELLIELKNRPDNKKFIIMVSSIEMAKKEYAKHGFDEVAEEAAKKY